MVSGVSTWEKQNLQQNEASSPANFKENTSRTEKSECKGSETEANMVHSRYERETSGKCWTETRYDLSQFRQADKHSDIRTEPGSYSLCWTPLGWGALNDEEHIL